MAQLPDAVDEQCGERQRGIVLMQRAVHDAPAGGPLLRREMSHCREKHGDARQARPHAGRFRVGFGHPQDILSWIEAFESGGIAVELVAQHDDEVPRGRGIHA